MADGTPQPGAGRRSLRTRLIVATAIAAVVAALGLVATSVPAAASTVDAHALRNENTTNCIDDSLQYSLRAYHCDGANYQEWNFYPQVDGNFAWYVLQNQATGYCLDDSQYGLRALQCYYNYYQQWQQQVGYDSNGPTHIYKNRVTGNCIDDSQYGLRSLPCDDQTYQMFMWR